MKVIVASFQYEACAYSSVMPSPGDFECAEGKDVFRKLRVQDVFADEGIESIPVFYANALPGGICPQNIFENFADKILSGVREHADADGILLCFHGSSEIENIGSGELELVKRIRTLVGPDPVISVSFDLHANIDERIIPLIDAVCGYKTAPHTDQTETQRAAAAILAKSIKGGWRPNVKIVKVPMLLTGDTLLTDKEPLKSLENETTAAEVGEVLRVNLFFSHMWVDAPNTCASVTVTAKDGNSAEKTAKEFAQKFWNTRRDYRFLVETGGVEDCVKKATEYLGGRVFLTDSGDNTTAGADGRRTDILNAFLKNGVTEKKICVSGITSPEIVCEAMKKKAGEEIDIPLVGRVEKGKILRYGKILGWAKDIIGDTVSVEIGNVTAVFTQKRSAFISKENFDRAYEDLESYDIIVVKQGYLFSELSPFCEKQFFVLSDGASCVDIFRLNLRKIPRPMFPLDDFDWNP